MHPTQNFVRRHQHDLTSTQVRTPADLVSHHSQDIPEQLSDLKTLLHSELLAQIVLSSSTCQVILRLLPLILVCQRGCLLFRPLRAGFSLMSPPDASACRTATCSSTLFSGTPGTSPTRALFLPLTRSVSAVLSLYAFILAFPAKVLSMIGSDSLSAFVIMWPFRFSVRCKRVSVSFNVRRQDVESSGFNLWYSFNHNPWLWGSCSTFVSCDFLRQLQFWSHHLPVSATHKPPQFVDSQASLNVRLVQLLHRTTPFLVVLKTALVRSW